MNEHFSGDEILSLEQRILGNLVLSQEKKEELLAVYKGTRIAPLTSAIMSEKIFSPDSNPDRFDFIMQRTMMDPSLKSDGSATNSPAIEFADTKKMIFDLPAWINDGRYANIEIQVIAQEFFFNRIDLYSSRMLLFQYSTDKGQKKDSVDYRNVNGVAIVALMKESPELFKNYKSCRYIHRFKDAVSDSGLRIPMLRNIAFVQLDKALDMFLAGNYNEDEDLELLKMFALMADPNNEKVRKTVGSEVFFETIYKDANRFSQDKGVQNMLFEEELAIMDFNTSINLAKEETIKKAAIEVIRFGIEDKVPKDVIKKRLEERFNLKPIVIEELFEKAKEGYLDN